MLLVNSILIFISKNVLKVRIAVSCYQLALLLCRSRTAIFSKKSYPLFADSNVTIKNKIDVNSSSNGQTMTLNCHLPARVVIIDKLSGEPEKRLAAYRNIEIKFGFLSRVANLSNDHI